jgi:hypothetical protein
MPHVKKGLNRIACQVAFRAGALAALVNFAAIYAIEQLGIKPGTGGLAQLVFGHALGPLESGLFHLMIGIAMAFPFVVVRNYLVGPGWLRGLLFAQVAGALQLFVVLPLTGHGIAGSHISPTTPLLAWSLTALYGVVLGDVTQRFIDRQRFALLQRSGAR